MSILQKRSKRKQTGGRYKAKALSRKKANLGRPPSLTKLDEQKTKKVRTRGGHYETLLLYTDKISVYDPKTKKYTQETIKTILENPANAQFVRRNIMTKGTIVETAKGKVKITSRPGQDASLSGTLMD